VKVTISESSYWRTTTCPHKIEIIRRRRRRRIIALSQLQTQPYPWIVISVVDGVKGVSVEIESEN